MGALTSKLYAYKARPWELSSHATVSIQDPFLTRVYIESRDNKILRIVPLVGTEEWIQDSTRFFISVKRLKHSTIKFYLNFWYKIGDAQVSAKKIALEICPMTEILYTLALRISQSANFTIILDKFTDGKTINILRSFNKHKNHIKINMANSFVPFNQNIFGVELSNIIQKLKIFVIQNKKAQIMLHSKLINYKYSHGDDRAINVNFHESLYLAEARYLLDHNINDAMLVSVTRFIPFFSFVKNKVILDALLHKNSFSIASSLLFSQSPWRKMNNLSLDLNSVSYSSNNNFAFSDVRKSISSVKYLFAKSNFFNQNLFFINLFGEINKTTSVSSSCFMHDNLLILINLSLTLAPLSKYVNLYLYIFKLIQCYI